MANDQCVNRGWPWSVRVETFQVQSTKKKWKRTFLRNYVFQIHLSDHENMSTNAIARNWYPVNLGDFTIGHTYSAPDTVHV